MGYIAPIQQPQYQQYHLRTLSKENTGKSVEHVHAIELQKLSEHREVLNKNQRDLLFQKILNEKRNAYRAASVKTNPDAYHQLFNHDFHEEKGRFISQSI